MRIALIAALGPLRVIGWKNDLPWRLPADLRRFKALTMGHPILMGRKTHESIGKPLPGRLSIVLTHQADFAADGCQVVHSMEEALAAAGEADELFVIGGASLYCEALPLASRIYFTRIEGEFEGDTFFPEFDESEWTEVAREEHGPDEKNRHPYAFCILERRG
ncbi:MAG: type 3 dihydrofolate reductase [Planctomycetota bacterium]